MRLVASRCGQPGFVVGGPWAHHSPVCDLWAVAPKFHQDGVSDRIWPTQIPSNVPKWHRATTRPPPGGFGVFVRRLWFASIYTHAVIRDCKNAVLCS